jgi:hypothetical protein
MDQLSIDFCDAPPPIAIFFGFCVAGFGMCCVGTAARTRAGGSRELVCGSCGYGVIVRREPPRCPMCRETDWRPIRSWLARRRLALDDELVAVA